MNTVPRTYRLDEIVEEIRRAEFITAPELACRLKVSVRTIQRDIQRIKQEYPQIYVKSGNGGGIGWDNIMETEETE